MGNKEIARQWIDTYNDADKERMASLMTEDSEVLIPAMGIAYGPRWERAGNAMNLVRNRTIEARRMTVSGDAVAIEFLWHAISLGGPGLAPAGERVEMENCIVLDFRDGLISRYVEYLGRIEGIDLAIASRRMLESPQSVSE
jgi:ketosteroid isomerase-like protein